jgi:PAS domain S-box-containing protein
MTAAAYALEDFPPARSLLSAVDLAYEALDAISDGVYVLDGQWRIVYLNAHCAREWGVSQAEVLGKVLWDALPILNGSDLAVQFSKVVREQCPTRFTTRCALKPECWVEMRAYPRQDGLVAHFTDVTDRIAAAKIARSREKKIRTILDAAPALISYIGPDYRYTMANQGYEIWSGLPPEQVVGSTVQEVWGDVGWKVIAPKLAQAFRGEYVAYEAQMLYRDGQARWVRCSYTPDRDADGKVCGVMVLSTDLTSQKKVELDLREREAYQSSVFDASGVGNAEVDLVSAQFLRVNRRFRELLGYSETELLDGRAIFDIIHPDDIERARDKLAQFLRQGGDSFQIEKRYVAKNGRVVWANVTTILLKSANGQANRILIVAHDISERKYAEQLLRESDQRKDEFLATLAHELRNPLAPISNALQAWSHLENKPEQARVVREMMERQVWQLRRLIDDLLDVSRISKGKIRIQKERLAISETIQAAIDTVRPHLDLLQHSLHVDLPDTTLHVAGDAGRLCQVFGNLLHNAAKYTERQGQLRITMSADGKDVVVRVSDSGVGIPREMLHSIFEPFTQVHTSIERSQGGLGIGLTLVKNIVELHSGTVEALSEGPHKGSEFVVRLPLAPADAGSDAVQERAKPPHFDRRAKPLRVLVVDDVAPSADTLGLMLEQLGHAVTVTHDGPTALDKARLLSPDVIFSDIAMPGMDGYQLAEQLNMIGGLKATLVALTGFGHDQSRRQVREAGFSFHLVKPTTLEDLEQLLGEVGRMR